jgi:CRP/FNR family cyclic AMP-dependent transcriptional regulator
MDTMRIQDLMAVMRLAWPGPFSEQTAGLLLARGRIVLYEPQAIIVRQGSVAKGLHIILQGQADVTVLRPSGKELVINILGPGQAYSFVHIYHPDPHSSSMVARTHCQVLTVSKHEWLLTTEECPELKDAVISIISSRLRGALEELTFSNLHSGLARLAHRLLVHVLQNPRPDFAAQAGAGREVALTQAHLATLLGLSRQRTHALLHQLEQRKALQLKYGRIEVIDLDALRQVIADSEAE